MPAIPLCDSDRTIRVVPQQKRQCRPDRLSSLWSWSSSTTYTTMLMNLGFDLALLAVMAPMMWYVILPLAIPVAISKNDGQSFQSQLGMTCSRTIFRPCDSRPQSIINNWLTRENQIFFFDESPRQNEWAQKKGRTGEWNLRASFCTTQGILI